MVTTGTLLKKVLTSDPLLYLYLNDGKTSGANLYYLNCDLSLNGTNAIITHLSV